MESQQKYCIPLLTICLWWDFDAAFISIMISNTNCGNHLIISGDIFFLLSTVEDECYSWILLAACTSWLTVTPHMMNCGCMNTQSVLITPTLPAALVNISRQTEWQCCVELVGDVPERGDTGRLLTATRSRIFLVVKAQWADGWLR